MIVCGLVRVQNVFDEMFYVKSGSSFFRLTLAEYSDRSRISARNRETIDEYGWYHVIYEQSFIENTYAHLRGSIKEMSISIAI
jgi:hypothetical protein